MAIVTTYVCDVTGKSGTEKPDFVEVSIVATQFQYQSSGYCSQFKAADIKKLVHKDVAQKLNLYHYEDAKNTVQPEVTFEGKLKALLEDFVQEIVEDNLADQGR